jgi:putative N6-adenine-specific DNA methylase
VEIAQFRIHDEQDVYKKSAQIDWTTFFRSNQTFAIKGAVNSGLFKNSHFPFLLVKDAIVDCFRDKNLERPNIELKTPNILIDLYIRENMVTLSINTSGAPLFHRGYRTETGSAPLNEVVAACLIRLSGWDRKTTFLDPFCGSGTILIEAALLAAGVPSSIERQHYAFKNLKNFDQQMWDKIYDEAPKNSRELPCRIFGSDIADEMVLKTRANLRSMSFGKLIAISVLDFSEIQKQDEPVFILTNPPYGQRLEADVLDLYSGIGDWLKNTMNPSTTWIITSNEDGPKSIGLRPGKKYNIYNGDIPCTFRSYETFSGSLKEFKSKSNNNSAQ